MSDTATFDLEAAKAAGYELVRAIEPKVVEVGAGLVRELEGSYVLEKMTPTGLHNIIAHSLEAALAQLEAWLAQHPGISGDSESKERIKAAVADGKPEALESLKHDAMPIAGVAPVGTAGMNESHPDYVAPGELKVDEAVEALPTASEAEAGVDAPEEPADEAPEGTVEA